MNTKPDRIEYVVICRGDTDPSAMYVFGAYELASRTVFATKEAAEQYASGIAAGRQALVISGRWGGLRWDAAERFPERS